MKKIILSITFIFSMISADAQVKLYNADLPYFNKSNLVKLAKTVKNVNNFTKRINNITEYNEKGQLHGISIQYRSDASVELIRYYHNNKLVYMAQPFMNGDIIQKVLNYSDDGSFNGVQAYTYLNADNKWTKIKLVYSDGRLTSIDDKLKFPKYTVNFKDGRLDGEFYFYDNANCNYYGSAKNGKIKNIMKLDIREDLFFKNTFYTINDKSIKSTFFVPYNKPIEDNIEIFEIPVIVENKNVHLDNDKQGIVFKEGHDWMNILTSPESYNSGEDEIDWSQASVGLPSPYKIQQAQH
ncbi:hypothetical protein [Chryseobacterium sp. ERMR1:04]|uniref:hypothetical protein n=1 Tax=Chryseobacterium sp. ERMR1:04 TaxID=1705393 RepID=UPI0006C8C46D|nr:hypothetical protein [Chryseobacterium sp. ERMR1:04]KPH14803.1 hypothetical protein AMQ68_05030 [Chryseobacterium sp. ERMR1:04]